MKIEKNNRYFNIAFYVVVTWLVILGLSSILLHLGETFDLLRTFLHICYMLFEPLIIGLVIAYLLDPLVDFYESRCHLLSFSNLFHGKKSLREKNKEKRWPMRTLPTLFAFLTFILILGLFILLIIMNIEQVAGSFSIAELKESLNGYVNYFQEMLGRFSNVAESLGISSGQESILEYLYGKINVYVRGFYRQFMAGLSVWGLHTMNWLLAFVIAFYLLQDSRRLWAVSKRLFSRILGSNYDSTYILFKKIDRAFAGYIRGEVLDSVIIIILTGTALTLIQLDFAIIISIISGIFNLIPYFGPVVGFFLTIVIGLLDPNPMKAVYGALAILVIQQIDGWFIVPKIVGNCVKLHPVIVLLVILIGGNLFGLIGMLLAVPVTAIVRILFIHFLPEYFEEGEE